MDANIRRDASEHEIADAASPQQQFEIGRVERSLARLVDDRLARQRRELGDDLPTRLAAHEDAPARPRVADARANAARAPALVLGQVRQVGAVPLARVNDVIALRSKRGERALDGLNGRAGQGDIVSHRIHVSSATAKIGLHVDDDERRVGGIKGAIIGPGVGIAGNGACFLGHLMIDSSPGTSRPALLEPAEATMMKRVRM